MKESQLIKVVFCCITLITVSVAQGQMGSINPSDGILMMYRIEGNQDKYVLSMNFESPEKAKTSLVVIGDTFSVQTRGEVCSVIMSNAYILQTTFGNLASNQVVQTKLRIDAWRRPFPKQTKLIFNNSIVELSKAKIEAPDEANMSTYEGEDALRQMKKMGLKPPDDMDNEKTVGHQK